MMIYSDRMPASQTPIRSARRLYPASASKLPTPQRPVAKTSSRVPATSPRRIFSYMPQTPLSSPKTVLRQLMPVMTPVHMPTTPVCGFIFTPLSSATPLRPTATPRVITADATLEAEDMSMTCLAVDAELPRLLSPALPEDESIETLPAVAAIHVAAAAAVELAAPVKLSQPQSVIPILTDDMPISQSTVQQSTEQLPPQQGVVELVTDDIQHLPPVPVIATPVIATSATPATPAACNHCMESAVVETVESGTDEKMRAWRQTLSDLERLRQRWQDSTRVLPERQAAAADAKSRNHDHRTKLLAMLLRIRNRVTLERQILRGKCSGDLLRLQLAQERRSKAEVAVRLARAQQEKLHLRQEFERISGVQNELLARERRNGAELSEELRIAGERLTWIRGKARQLKDSTRALREQLLKASFASQAAEQKQQAIQAEFESLRDKLTREKAKRLALVQQHHQQLENATAAAAAAAATMASAAASSSSTDGLQIQQQLHVLKTQEQQRQRQVESAERKVEALRGKMRELRQRHERQMAEADNRHQKEVEEYMKRLATLDSQNQSIRAKYSELQKAPVKLSSSSSSSSTRSSKPTAVVESLQIDEEELHRSLQELLRDHDDNQADPNWAESPIPKPQKQQQKQQQQRKNQAKRGSRATEPTPISIVVESELPAAKRHRGKKQKPITQQLDQQEVLESQSQPQKQQKSTQAKPVVHTARYEAQIQAAEQKRQKTARPEAAVSKAAPAKKPRSSNKVTEEAEMEPQTPLSKMRASLHAKRRTQPVHAPVATIPPPLEENHANLQEESLEDARSAAAPAVEQTPLSKIREKLQQSRPKAATRVVLKLGEDATHGLFSPIPPTPAPSRKPLGASKLARPARPLAGMAGLNPKEALRVLQMQRKARA